VLRQGREDSRTVPNPTRLGAQPAHIVDAAAPHASVDHAPTGEAKICNVKVVSSCCSPNGRGLTRALRLPPPTGAVTVGGGPTSPTTVPHLPVLGRHAVATTRHARSTPAPRTCRDPPPTLRRHDPSRAQRPHKRPHAWRGAWPPASAPAPRLCLGAPLLDRFPSARPAGRRDRDCTTEAPADGPPPPHTRAAGRAGATQSGRHTRHVPARQPVSTSRVHEGADRRHGRAQGGRGGGTGWPASRGPTCALAGKSCCAAAAPQHQCAGAGRVAGRHPAVNTACKGGGPLARACPHRQPPTGLAQHARERWLRVGRVAVTVNASLLGGRPNFINRSPPLGEVHMSVIATWCCKKIRRRVSSLPVNFRVTVIRCERMG